MAFNHKVFFDIARPAFKGFNQAQVDALNAAIDAALKPGAAAFNPVDLPWLVEAEKYMGLHEARNFDALFKFLKSDGRAVGDPRKLPWCGDFVETVVKRTLPNEPLLGALGKNPYLARNWMLFGTKSEGKRGDVAVFWRGDRNGVSGHVGFALGYDPTRKKIRVRNGNVNNMVEDSWLDEARLLGYRSPTTYSKALPKLPTMNSAGAVTSTNEA